MDVVRRTTIFLPDALHEQLRKEAFAARISMAQLIRSRLERRTHAKNRRSKTDPLRKVEGIIRDGNLSQSIDEVLYGH